MSGFPHTAAGHCASGALRDLLEHHGLDHGAGPLSEGFVFGAGSGLDFHFSLSPRRDPWPRLAPPVWAMGRSFALERDACTHLGIELDCRRTDDAALALDWLREELGEGRPTMVWADIAGLEYLDVQMHNAHHTLVVVGLDEDRGVATVADQDEPELVECSLPSLAAARASRAYPSPTQHTTWVMRFPERLPSPATTVHRALARTVEIMGGRRRPWDPRSQVGLRAIDGFCESYGKWPAQYGDQLAGALRRLGVFIAAAGTGGSMFRGLQARFLADAGALLDDDRLLALGDRHAELARTWRGLARATRASDPRDAHAQGAGLVAQIERFEHACVEEAAAWLRRARTALAVAA